MMPASVATTETIVDRKHQWEREIRPQTDEARFALDRAVVASLRLEQCEAAFDAMASQHLNRARDDWDADRRLDAARLLDRLSKKPVLIAAELEATPQGCELKVRLWNSLGETIDTVGVWTDAQSSLALDLLGIPPALRTGPTPIEARPGRDTIEHRRNLAINEIKRLNDRMVELSTLDAIQRRHAERGATAILTPAAALIQRYERDAWRRFQAAMRVARSKPQAVEPARNEEAVPDEPEIEPEIEANPLPDFPAPSLTLPIANPSDQGLNRRQRLALKSQRRRA
jgi:hypothetical protein